MSELKDYKVYTTINGGAWGYHYEPNPNKDQSDIKLNDKQVYLKKDVDKVIDEKDKEIAQWKGYRDECERQFQVKVEEVSDLLYRIAEKDKEIVELKQEIERLKKENEFTLVGVNLRSPTSDGRLV